MTYCKGLSFNVQRSAMSLAFHAKAAKLWIWRWFGAWFGVSGFLHSARGFTTIVVVSERLCYSVQSLKPPISVLRNPNPVIVIGFWFAWYLCGCITKETCPVWSMDSDGVNEMLWQFATSRFICVILLSGIPLRGAFDQYTVINKLRYMCSLFCARYSITTLPIVQYVVARPSPAEDGEFGDTFKIGGPRPCLCNIDHS